MAKFKIRAVYEYEAEVFGDDEKDATNNFLTDLNDHYVSTEEWEIEEIELYMEDENDSSN